LNQRGNIPPHALLQWRSDVNVARVYDQINSIAGTC